MTDDQAVRTLQGVEAIQLRTREAVIWGWLPLLAFGIATAVSVPFTQLDDGYALAIYWLVAGPAAFALSLVGYRRMEERSGVIERNERLYGVLIATTFAVALAIGLLADDGIASQVGPAFAVGIGLVVIAALDRSALLALAGSLVLLLGIALAVIAPADAATWVAAGEGAVLIGAGLIARGQAVGTAQ